MAVDKVLLAAPRGFCAGVEMAIKALAWMVRAFEPPVYCYHEIVHNQLVVDRFRALGVVFVDDIAEVPPGRPIMLSAHGSAPEVVAAARASGGYVVDAVCPLVTKVHHEAKVRAGKGFTVLYVGHRGHDEAAGTLAVAPESIRLVEDDDDLTRVLPTVPDPSRVALLAQTTLSIHDWEGIMERARDQFPELWTAARNASEADAIVVIGSANSSNTLALAKVARAAGCPVVLRVDGPEELDAASLDGARVVGVTAGASAPEDLVQAVIARLAPTDGVVPVHVTEEDEYFPPPRELRELMATLDRVAPVLLGGAAGGVRAGAFTDDRRVDASDVLASS
jgi:4-hydroxy-3-methylbut-2-enyl diphosphate reductase